MGGRQEGEWEKERKKNSNPKIHFKEERCHPEERLRDGEAKERLRKKQNNVW